jgi:hypothetical protein
MAETVCSDVFCDGDFLLEGRRPRRVLTACAPFFNFTTRWKHCSWTRPACGQHASTHVLRTQRDWGTAVGALSTEEVLYIVVK